MKKISWIFGATLLFVGCGSSDEIKLSDQTGFHQAVEFGKVHGLAVMQAKSYDEFKAASDETKRYADAFKTQLGGESYLAYLKCVTSAANGTVLSEDDIDMDSDILNIRNFYKTNTTSNEYKASAATQLGQKYAAQLKGVTTKEEYIAVRDEIIAQAQKFYNNGDKAGYNDFVCTVFAEEFTNFDTFVGYY